MRSSSGASIQAVAALGAADVEGADAALVVGGDRDGLDRPLDLLGVEAGGGEPFAAELGDHLLGAGAGGHALGLHAGQGAGAALGGDRGAEEAVDLLGRVAGRRRLHRLRVARLDRDLGAAAVLASRARAGRCGRRGSRPGRPRRARPRRSPRRRSPRSATCGRRPGAARGRRSTRSWRGRGSRRRRP